MPQEPDVYRAWIGIARDAAIVVVGVFMLLYETAFVPSPNPYVIGAGLTALGIPAAMRLDMKNKSDEK